MILFLLAYDNFIFGRLLSKAKCEANSKESIIEANLEEMANEVYFTNISVSDDGKVNEVWEYEFPNNMTEVFDSEDFKDPSLDIQWMESIEEMNALTEESLV